LSSSTRSVPLPIETTSRFTIDSLAVDCSSPATRVSATSMKPGWTSTTVNSPVFFLKPLVLMTSPTWKPAATKFTLELVNRLAVASTEIAARPVSSSRR